MKRQCGTCSLCCRLLPVEELQKLASQRCKHQRHTGCNIYAKRPLSCMFWNCEWLATEADLPRPDRAGYVVDVMPDMVRCEDHETGAETKLIVRQIWLDPLRPDAWKHCKQLTKWMEKEARNNVAFLFRRDSARAFTMLPPQMNTTGDWVIVGSREDGGSAVNATSVGVERKWNSGDVIEEMMRQGLEFDVRKLG